MRCVSRIYELHENRKQELHHHHQKCRRMQAGQTERPCHQYHTTCSGRRTVRYLLDVGVLEMQEVRMQNRLTWAKMVTDVYIYIYIVSPLLGVETNG